MAAKFKERARVLGDLDSLGDPQIKFQLMRLCVCSRPVFWLRALAPALTHDAARDFDHRVRASLEKMADARIPDLSHLAWRVATLPQRLGGPGLRAQVTWQTRGF